MAIEPVASVILELAGWNVYTSSPNTLERREWAYQCLKKMTNEDFGMDAQAWIRWYKKRDFREYVMWLQDWPHTNLDEPDDPLDDYPNLWKIIADNRRILLLRREKMEQNKQNPPDKTKDTRTPSERKQGLYEALKTLTHKDFGMDVQAWLRWYKKHFYTDTDRSIKRLLDVYLDAFDIQVDETDDPADDDQRPSVRLLYISAPLLAWLEIERVERSNQNPSDDTPPPNTTP